MYYRQPIIVIKVLYCIHAMFSLAIYWVGQKSKLNLFSLMVPGNIKYAVSFFVAAGPARL